MEPLKDNLMSKTSWTDDELEKLCNPKSHRIIYDGFEYWWEHRISSNNWDLHYLEGFKDYKVPYYWLKIWLYKWAKELAERKVDASKSYLKEMQQYLKATEKAIEVADAKGIKTKTKIEMIQELLPNQSITAMASMLKISTQAIHKHLKNEN
jgi:hypothetical protein